MILKFEVYCSCLQSDGHRLRFIRRFDSIDDVCKFLHEFKYMLEPTWKIVQTHTSTTEREKIQLYTKSKPFSHYEQELPF